MNKFLQDTLRGVEGSARDAAQKVIWRLTFGISVGLIGLAGLGFLAASAYLTLSSAVGLTLAALIIGVGLILLAGGLLLLSKRSSSKPAPEDAGKATPVASRTGGANLAPTIAFTAAYVLARYLSADRPE